MELLVCYQLHRIVSYVSESSLILCACVIFQELVNDRMICEALLPTFQRNFRYEIEDNSTLMIHHRRLLT